MIPFQNPLRELSDSRQPVPDEPLLCARHCVEGDRPGLYSHRTKSPGLGAHNEPKHQTNKIRHIQREIRTMGEIKQDMRLEREGRWGH